MLPSVFKAGLTAKRSMKMPSRPTTAKPATTASASQTPCEAKNAVSIAQSIISEPCPKLSVRVVQNVMFKPMATSA